MNTHSQLVLHGTKLSGHCSYVAHAPEGGVALEGYASIRDWLRRIERLPHFKPIPPLPHPVV